MSEVDDGSIPRAKALARSREVVEARRMSAVEAGIVEWMAKMMRRIAESEANDEG